MVDLVSQGVFEGVAAAVVRLAVVLLALHLPFAQRAVDGTFKNVDVPGAVLFVLVTGAVPPFVEQCLDGVEGVLVYDRRVHRLGRGHPLLARVPPHHAGVPHRHVVDLEQNLVGALLVPDLVPRVPGVRQNYSDRALRPRHPGPVRVPRPVICRRTRDSVGGQPSAMSNRQA